MNGEVAMRMLHRNLPAALKAGCYKEFFETRIL